MYIQCHHELVEKVSWSALFDWNLYLWYFNILIIQTETDSIQNKATVIKWTPQGSQIIECATYVGEWW